MRDWSTATGDVRNNAAIATEMLGFIEKHGALSIIMTDRIIGCPHQTGIDYEGDWCPDPACAYWYKRDRFTGGSSSPTWGTAAYRMNMRRLAATCWLAVVVSK